MSGAVKGAVKSGRHDPGATRTAKRSGRERGCWVYIPAEVLVASGIDLDKPPPQYRCWGGRKRTLLVQLYE